MRGITGLAREGVQGCVWRWAAAHGARVVVEHLHTACPIASAPMRRERLLWSLCARVKRRPLDRAHTVAPGVALSAVVSSSICAESAASCAGSTYATRAAPSSPPAASAALNERPRSTSSSNAEPCLSGDASTGGSLAPLATGGTAATPPFAVLEALLLQTESVARELVPKALTACALPRDAPPRRRRRSAFFAFVWPSPENPALPERGCQRPRLGQREPADKAWRRYACRKWVGFA